MTTISQQVLQLQDTAHSTAHHVISAATSTFTCIPSETDLKTLFVTTMATLAICIGTLLLLCVPTLILSVIRLRSILTRPPPAVAGTQEHIEPGTSSKPRTRRGHLLILLGSGGHTAEMLGILRNLGREYLDTRFERRTWVVSSGDAFSMGRAREVEEEWAVEREQERVRRDPMLSRTFTTRNEKRGQIRKGRTGPVVEGAAQEWEGEYNHNQYDNSDVQWNLVTVRRARRVHQSLLSTPITALGCLWDCIAVLRGKSPTNSQHEIPPQASSNNKSNKPLHQPQYPYPDLILTNGPGTGVILVLASLILLFLGLAPVSRSHHGQATKPSPSPPPQTDLSILDTNSNSDGRTGNIKGDEVVAMKGSMRSIYIESWARVKSMSLSGRILRFLGARVLVQWRGLADGAADLTRVEEADVSDNAELDKEGPVSGRKRSRSKTDLSWPRKMEFVGAVVT